MEVLVALLVLGLVTTLAWQPVEHPVPPSDRIGTGCGTTSSTTLRIMSMTRIQVWTRRTMPQILLREVPLQQMLQILMLLLESASDLRRGSARISSRDSTGHDQGSCYYTCC